MFEVWILPTAGTRPRETILTTTPLQAVCQTTLPSTPSTEGANDDFVTSPKIENSVGTVPALIWRSRSHWAMQLITAWDSAEVTWSLLGLRLVLTRSTGSLAPRLITSAARGLTLAAGTTQFKHSLAQPGEKSTSQASCNADVSSLSTLDDNLLFAASECLEGPDLGVGRVFNHSWTESTLYNTEIRCWWFWKHLFMKSKILHI